jgi:F-type H+-transporting ATPase subunit b
MLIDWFTVGAQALNFVILVWLLKRFLYKPILSALDAREKKVADELADADKRQADARKERDEFQHKSEKLDEQRAALLRKATDEAGVERERLLADARQAAEALSAQRREGLRSDARNLNQAISRRTQQEVFAITRKVLTDLATTSLEERLGEVFTRHLREMDGAAKDSLASAVRTAPDPVLVRSAFELPADQRAAIQNALNETFSAAVRVKFETAPDLVSGIELATSGQKVGWTIAGYLASLENGVVELLMGQEKAEVAPRPDTEAKSEARREPETEVRTEAKPEADGERKPETARDPKSETIAEPKPGDQAERKSEAPKHEAPGP